jgi:hypothetical protein
MATKDFAFGDLDKELAAFLNETMKMGSAIELPFPAVYLWAVNGQASYKSQGGALYFGGFACKADNVTEVLDGNLDALPASWENTVISSRDGGEFDAYVTRSVVVAPFGQRESWLLDGQRYPDYQDGARRHLQVLAYLADRDEAGTQYTPWGPVVLSAKGYQAKNLKGALAQWKKDSRQAIAQIAPGVSPHLFYTAIGTFGKERQATQVGKPGAQSPITPIGLQPIPEITKDMLLKMFVGQETLRDMARLAGEAKEWLNAWKNITHDAPTNDSEQGMPDEFSGTPWG